MISLYTKEQDTYALGVLLESYKKRLLKKLLSKTNRKEDAKDLLQEIYIKVQNSLDKGKYNDEGKFFAWLYLLAERTRIDKFRKDTREKMDIFPIEKQYSLADNTVNTEEKIMLEESLKQMKECISTLPIEQKEVLEMRIKEYSFEDIADIQGVGKNTVLGRRFYALKKLQKSFREISNN